MKKKTALEISDEIGVYGGNLDYITTLEMKVKELTHEIEELRRKNEEAHNESAL